ncbi:hypothetical protein Bca4012_068192 [Brassica carinata]|uniref:Uncharacterized protein n=1 Tax=Brassica carinata TaxID=52824 RepID=A0A8X7VTI3_BRACI|nr:hypothetical protein Bca52824_020423 [Brassica carinata]
MVGFGGFTVVDEISSRTIDALCGLVKLISVKDKVMVLVGSLRSAREAESFTPTQSLEVVSAVKCFGVPVEIRWVPMCSDETMGLDRVFPTLSRNGDGQLLWL